MSLAKIQRALTREARRAQRELGDAVVALARVHVVHLTSSTRTDREATIILVARALSRISAAADLGGRIEVRFSRKAASPEQFAANPPDVFPSVAFGEAIRDLEERDPVGAADLRRAGLEVEDAYGAQIDPSTGKLFYAHAFAASRAIDAEVAARVRDRIVKGLSTGETTDDVAADLSKTWDWPRSYSALVARNAFNTATTAGRFREAERVASFGIPTGFEFQAVMDANTRPGHAALNGMKFRSDDPILRSWSPPLAPNCRCLLSPLIGDDVPVGFVTLPPGAEKDPGYGTRPDLAAYR